MASDGYLPSIEGRGKYPALATDTEVNSCLSIYLNCRIIWRNKMISMHLFIKRLHFIWGANPALVSR